MSRTAVTSTRHFRASFAAIARRCVVKLATDRRSLTDNGRPATSACWTERFDDSGGSWDIFFCLWYNVLHKRTTNKCIVHRTEGTQRTLAASLQFALINHRNRTGQTGRRTNVTAWRRTINLLTTHVSYSLRIA